MKSPLLSSTIPAIFLIILFSLVSTGCGKKSSPVALESTSPAPVSDLRAWPREGTILLGWGVPTRNTDGSGLEDLLGFKVFRQTRPLTLPHCPDYNQDSEEG